MARCGVMYGERSSGSSTMSGTGHRPCTSSHPPRALSSNRRARAGSGPVRAAAHGDGEVARQPNDLAALALVERLQCVAERRPAQPERRGVEIGAPDRPHRLQRAVGADGAVGRRTRQAGVPQLDATVDAGGVGPVDPSGAGQWRQHQAVGQLDGGLGDGRRGRLGPAGELFCRRRRREGVGRHARFPRVPVEQRLERQRQLGLLGREPKGEARGVCRSGGDGCRDERLLACGGLVEGPLLDVLRREGDDDEGVDVGTGTGSDEPRRIVGRRGEVDEPEAQHEEVVRSHDVDHVVERCDLQCPLISQGRHSLVPSGRPRGRRLTIDAVRSKVARSPRSGGRSPAPRRWG